MQILDITSVRRGSRIKWINVEKKNDPDSFLRKWSPHLRSCHYFALLTCLWVCVVVVVAGGGCGYTSLGDLICFLCLLR